MSLDALTLSAVVKELNTLLSGGKINKITQPAADTVVFNVYRDRTDYRLVLAADSSSPKLFISDSEYPNPPVPPSFCMHLRKHILNAEILSISMPPEERAVKFSLRTNTEFFGAESKTLVYEMMGRYSNIFVVAADGIISDCLKRIAPDLVAAARNTLPGLPYIEPPVPPEILPAIRGISHTAAAELTARAKAAGTTELAELQKMREEFSPVVYLSGGVPFDFGFTPYITQKGEQRAFPSMRDAMAYFYRETEIQKAFATRLGKLNSAVNKETAKNEKTLKTLSARLEDCQNSEENKIHGDLITANIYKIKPRDTELVTENFYGDNMPVKITLDKALSPAQNAQRYYKKYTKQKKTLTMTNEQIAEVLEKLGYLASVKYSLSAAGNISELSEIEAELIEAKLIPPPKTKGKQKKTEAKAPAVVSHSFGGFEIFRGKNNIQNEYATFRIAADNDLWLHVQGAAGSHIVIKSGGKQIPDEVLLYAARLAAENSEQKGAPKTAVDYCLRKFVKKSRAGIGRVHYTGYKTIII